MKKIAFVVPWAGPLPAYFSLWLHTCAGNPTVDFLLFTSENIAEPLPPNVQQYKMDFEQLQKLFQRHYEFPLALKQPYKFCDFKPAYGEIFAEYLREYDFWGHCDVDLLWGNIRKFITENQLERYDRIYTRGHCSLYRNVPEVNCLYRTLPHEGMQDWKTVFSNDGSFCFDEWHQGGFSEIIRRNKIPYYDAVDFADLDVSKGWLSPLRMEKFQNRKTYFTWKNGTIWACTPDGEKQEILYCHFQKRKLTILPWNTDLFYLTAPGRISSEPEEWKKVYWVQERRFEMNYWRRRIQNKLRKMRKGGTV